MKSTGGNEQVPIALDYRCKRCNAPFQREMVMQCTVELHEQNEKWHHCIDGGVGFGELVGFHDIRLVGDHSKAKSLRPLVG